VGEGPQAVLHHAGIGQLPSGAGGQLPEKLAWKLSFRANAKAVIPM
jgi:hypothetical protein